MERILIASPEPFLLEVLSTSNYDSQHYQVRVVSDGPQALTSLLEFVPDVLLTSLELPGLRGVDLLAAVRAQQLPTACIVLLDSAQERQALEAFRLGAVDYLTQPVREAELVTVIDRALEATRLRRERAEMQQKLEAVNIELQQQMREMSALMLVGKNIAQFQQPETLFGGLVEAAVGVANADCGWLVQRQSSSQQFVLEASLRLPEVLGVARGSLWQGGVETNVATARRALNAAGASLTRVPLGKFARSVAAVPVLVRDEAIGVLVVARREMVSFSTRELQLLQALADYTATAIVNTRLFDELDRRARHLQVANQELQTRDNANLQLLRRLGSVLQSPIDSAQAEVSALLKAKFGQLLLDQEEALLRADGQLAFARQALQQMVQVVQYNETGNDNLSGNS